MINIIINEDVLEDILNRNNNLRFIRLPFQRYNTVIASERGISKGIENIINVIEECTVNKAGDIKSKFTDTYIGLDKLSDGSKTVIYVYYRTKVVNKNEIINITECGPNAIEYILKNYSNSDLTLYLGHLEIPRNLECTFKINGDIINNTNEIFE